MNAASSDNPGPDREKNEMNGPSVEQGEEKARSLSMHEDIPVWYDCCSCEAEPYWEDALSEQARKEKT